jgi:hypothetical protein
MLWTMTIEGFDRKDNKSSCSAAVMASFRRRPTRHISAQSNPVDGASPENRQQSGLIERPPRHPRTQARVSSKVAAAPFVDSRECEPG